MPVEIEHHAEHSQKREDVDEHAKESLRDEILYSVNVARHADDEIARLMFLVIGKRKPLDVIIDTVSKVMQNALAHARREIFFRVGCDRADESDGEHGDRREIEKRELIVPECRANRAG